MGQADIYQFLKRREEYKTAKEISKATGNSVASVRNAVKKMTEFRELKRRKRHKQPLTYEYQIQYVQENTH